MGKVNPHPQGTVEWYRWACAAQNADVCQILAKALGYPRYMDDQDTFPGATEANGYFYGEHVAETLAEQAARRIAELEKAARRLAKVEAALA